MQIFKRRAGQRLSGDIDTECLVVQLGNRKTYAIDTETITQGNVIEKIIGSCDRENIRFLLRLDGR